MSDVALRPYSRTEAERATERFLTTGIGMRHQLLDLHERKAHIALGFSDFESYAHEKLGVEWKQAYLDALRSWARVERDVFPELEAGEMDPARLIAGRSLTKHIAIELSRLPNAERAEAYQEALGLRADNPLRDIKHIVNRRLGVSDSYKKPAAVPAPTPPPETKPRPAVSSFTPAPDPGFDEDVPVGAVVDTQSGKQVEEPEPEPEVVPPAIETRLNDGKETVVYGLDKDLRKPAGIFMPTDRYNSLCALSAASTRLRDALAGHNEKNINLTAARSEALAEWKSAVAACE